MKYLFFTVSLFFLTLTVKSQTFDDHFENKTLRVDYIFTGDNATQTVSLEQLNQLPQWAGRRHNLTELGRQGNGQIKITELKSGKCIYMESFSTLFQEWLTIPEASTIRKSFENTFLLPYPKGKVDIEVRLREKDGSYKTSFKHTVDPSDILIKKKGFKNMFPHTFVHQGGSIEKCINVVILAEGYTLSEMGKFRNHAKAACEQILAHSPFNRMQDRFNFIAVETESKDSGVSVPRENKWNETAFHSHFDTFYSDRYLTTTNVNDVHDRIAGIPYAHIIILANTDVYGGGGIFNAYTLTTTGHPDFNPVVVHEFGHSFGGLADEYYYENDTFSDSYPFDVEPWEPNITTLVDFDLKWKSLLLKNTPIPTDIQLAKKYPIGVFEGAGYSSKGLYRPAIDCRMKTNSCKDFCTVCQKGLEQLIKFYTE